MTDSEKFKTLLFGLVKRAKADMERQFARAGILVTPFEFSVLAKLKHKPATLAEIAKVLGLKSPSVLPAVDSLERKLFLKRQADPKDRRKIRLTMTAKGEALFKSILKGHPDDILNRSFNSLPKRKRSELLSLLTELTDNLNE